MKYLFIYLLTFFWSVRFADAQKRINYYPDSIRIELPEQKTIAVIELREFKNNVEFIKTFPAFLKEQLEHVQKSSPGNFSETGPYRIEVRLLPEGEKEILSTGTTQMYKTIGEKTLITIRKIDQPQTMVTVKEKTIVELLPPGWEFSILSKDFKVTIYSESFQSLLSVGSIDLTEVANRLVTDAFMKSLGKKSIRSRTILRENKIDYFVLSRNYPGDNIFLTATAGVGLFRDKLYPQLSFKLGLTFTDHFARQNIRTSLVYDNLFFADKATEGYLNNVNSFLSLSFEKNFNTKTKSAQWMGIGAGLLVRKNGDYFTGNTAKFFIIHEMENRRIGLIPEFYLTDDFKKFAFGMTLKYTF